jgi:N-acylmannosamine kinase
MNKAVVLDVGGTRMRAAVAEGGRLLWRAQRPTPTRDGPEGVLTAIVDLLAPVAAEDAALAAAIAGQVDADGRVTMHNRAIFPGWQAWPLRERLAARLGRPVRVLNDARAAAWGEYLHGAGRGCSEFMFVTVSTGVGAGLVLGGRLHLAANGLDAELGETLTADGRPLEALASGSTLDHAARERGWADASAWCNAADAGDAAAEALLQHGVDELARKLADLTVLLGVQRTAVGGGLGLRPGYLARLQRALQRWPVLYRHELVPAELGPDAGLVGAAALACPTD